MAIHIKIVCDLFNEYDVQGIVIDHLHFGKCFLPKQNEKEETLTTNVWIEIVSMHAIYCNATSYVA